MGRDTLLKELFDLVGEHTDTEERIHCVISILDTIVDYPIDDITAAQSSSFKDILKLVEDNDA